ncbi:MAG TPA: hypothetical protein PK413_04655, partial [Thermoanaerobaculia bacterium]|nr:hypothetical protein [Thermoanaerobaculia bacterium]
ATLAALALTYGAANWGYRRAAGERALELYCRGQASLVAEERLQRFEAPLLGLAHYWPGGAQFAVGLLGVAEQNRIGVYPSYALGDLRSTGRWWYFPVVFALKTPLALLVALAAALVAALRRLRLAQISAGELLARARPFAPMLSLVFLYLALALSSNYNIGFRHLLPVLPILYLPAVAWAARKRWRALALVGILALESVALTPAWVAATNTWWLGAANPTRFALSGGDLDARQGFLLLGTEAERLGVEELGVLYPLLPPEELHAYLPRARAVQPGEPLRAGWYAVSASLEQYVPALLGAPSGPLHGREGLMELARAWQPSLEALRGGEDHGYLAGTFHLYRLPPPSG